MNAGALTFSVTLLGTFGMKHPHWEESLHGAWVCLLIAIAACLVRNLSHQHYQLADAMTKLAESEIAYIEIDHEIVSTQTVIYSDSSEPFDREREIALDGSNREVWQKSLAEQQNNATRNWRLVVGAEWTAGISMVLGFMFLVLFAIHNL
jgi:hypothetical protein